MKTKKGLGAHSTVAIPVVAFFPNPILFVIEQLYAQIIANQIYCPFTSHL